MKPDDPGKVNHFRAQVWEVGEGEKYDRFDNFKSNLKIVTVCYVIVEKSVNANKVIYTSNVRCKLCH